MKRSRPVSPTAALSAALSGLGNRHNGATKDALALLEQMTPAQSSSSGDSRSFSFKMGETSRNGSWKDVRDACSIASSPNSSVVDDDSFRRRCIPDRSAWHARRAWSAHHRDAGDDDDGVLEAPASSVFERAAAADPPPMPRAPPPPTPHETGGTVGAATCGTVIEAAGDSPGQHFNADGQQIRIATGSQRARGLSALSGLAALSSRSRPVPPQRAGPT